MREGAGPRRHLVTLLRLVVALLLFYVILRDLDWKRFAESIANMRPLYCVLVCLAYPVNLAIGSIRLKCIFSGYRLPISATRAFTLNWIAAFFNNFLPTSVGGDVYRVLYLNRRYPESPAQVISSVVLDRGLGLLAMLILVGMTSPLFVGTLLRDPWAIALFYAAVILIATAALFVLFYQHDFRVRWTSKNGSNSRIANGFNILINYPDKRILFRSLLLSFAYVALIVFSNYFLFRAFGARISLLTLFFVVPMVNIAGLLPISINALGVTEGVGILLFSQFGVKPEVILSVFLTGRVLLILCSATGGIPLLYRNGGWMHVARTTT